MKNNKHPHHDLIVEWAKDTKKNTQRKNSCKEWVDCSGALIADDEDGQFEFRFKPREFVKGHWYPCLDGNRKFVAMWNGKDFSEPVNCGRGINRITWSPFLIKVGKSLGEINFGE